MSRWFRFYDDAINDAKVLRLSDADFRAWVTLLCLASKHDGELPATADIALVLRMKTSRVAEWLTVLTAGGLLDQDGDRFRPHNWAKRQFVSDRDATAADRKRRERDKKRSPQGVTRDVTDMSRVTVTDVSQPPEQIQNRTDVDDAGDAGARAGGLSGPEALNLAEKLLVIAGHDPKFWPPGWCGAPMRVQMWLDQGWKAEIIIAAVTAGAARKRGEPANSVQFFERTIAEEHARQAAPLPKIEIREAETITVTNHAKPRSGIIAAADDLVERIASFDGPGRGSAELRGPKGAPAPRLLSNG